MTTMSGCSFDFVKSRMMSTVIFFAFPYGLIGFYGGLEKIIRIMITSIKLR
jgi:hypothetical protein